MARRSCSLTSSDRRRPCGASPAPRSRHDTDHDATEVFEWIEPQAGVVCFRRIRADMGVDVDRFYSTLFEQHGTYVGAGHWFDQDRRFFRPGFAWPTKVELVRGLETLEQAGSAASRRAPRSSLDARCPSTPDSGTSRHGTGSAGAQAAEHARILRRRALPGTVALVHVRYRL